MYVGQDEQLGSILSKTVKKVRKKIAPVLGFQAGMLTLGLVKPKALGIRSKAAKKGFKVGKKVGKVAAVVVAAVVAAPVVGPMLAGAGSAIGGGLSSAGAAMLSAGKLAASGAATLASKGTGVVTNFFSKKGVGTEVAKIATKEILSGKRPMPPELEQELRNEGANMARTGQVTEASLFGFGMSSQTQMIVLGFIGVSLIFGLLNAPRSKN